MPIFRRVYREDLEYIYSWLDGDDYLRQGVLESSLYRGALYGVEVDGKIEAISIIHPIGDIAWLMGARVRREARGRGIGRYMTAGLLEEAGRMGMRGSCSPNLCHKYSCPQDLRFPWHEEDHGALITINLKNIPWISML